MELCQRSIYFGKFREIVYPGGVPFNKARWARLIGHGILLSLRKNNRGKVHDVLVFEKDEHILASDAVDDLVKVSFGMPGADGRVDFYLRIDKLFDYLEFLFDHGLQYRSLLACRIIAVIPELNFALRKDNRKERGTIPLTHAKQTALF